MRHYTEAEIITLITENWGEDAPAVLNQVEVWLGRGDGIAVYENRDLGHPDVGVVRLASFGGPHAQLEGDPPETHPDLVGEPPLWRYRLVGIHKR